jgi:hypothetical protein
MQANRKTREGPAPDRIGLALPIRMPGRFSNAFTPPWSG